MTHLQPYKFLTIFFILLIICIQPAFARLIKLSDESIIFCPEKIICDQADVTKSCRPSGEYARYWSLAFEDGRVNKGEYDFYEAYSSYQRQENDGRYTACRYVNRQSGFEKYIQFSSNIYFRLEANIENENLWDISGYRAHCENNDSIKCPLTKFKGVTIDFHSYEQATHKNVINFLVYANNILLGESNDPSKDTRFLSISYDSILNACAAVRLCKLDLMADHSSNPGKEEKIGHLFVDTEDNVKTVYGESMCGANFKVETDSKINKVYFSTID